MSTWDGVSGAVVGRIMATQNADMERNTVDRLAPAPAAAVLELGYGPGVGIALLRERVAFVAGVDPSPAMRKLAAKRNRIAVADGSVELVTGGAERLPFADARFDGAIAVNSIQLWEPFDASVAELARVLRPDGRFVSSVHEWAVAKHAPVGEWIATTERSLTAHGFDGVETTRGRARSGATIVTIARMRH